MSKRGHELRDEFNRARRKGKLGQALAALEALEKLERDEPRWPHQQGELLRLMGRVDDAASAWERAIQRYEAQGFVARAVALGKALVQIAPDRREVLERIDPGPAREAVDRALTAAPAGRLAPKPSLLASVRPLDPSSSQDDDDDEIAFVDIDEDDLVEIDLAELRPATEPPPLPMSLAPADPKASGRSLARLAMMPSFGLFSDVEKATLARLMKDATLVELPDGTPVVEAGEPADALYCIVDGQARVVVPGEPDQAEPRLLSEGDVFGESCLLDQAERAADVLVKGALVALRIPKDGLDRAVHADARLREVLFELLTRRLVANLLTTSPLFGAFDPEQRRELAGRFALRSLEPGAVLLAAGKRPDGLYLLLTGDVALEEPGGARGTAGPGAILGQRSLLHREPAQLTVTAARPSIVLRLPATRFSTFAALYPPALDHLTRLAAEPAPLLGRGDVDTTSLRTVA
ncbi:MAG: cyclic nucleotide-binding domain-containing protein [Sandaracinaceae bacterium]